MEHSQEASLVPFLIGALPYSGRRHMRYSLASRPQKKTLLFREEAESTSSKMDQTLQQKTLRLADGQWLRVSALSAGCRQVTREITSTHILTVFITMVSFLTQHCMRATFRLLRPYSTTGSTHYQVLELLPHASLKEIKMQFKRLLKKHHPDVNAHLTEAEKQENNERYVQMVQAYETLKDARKKREYDATLSVMSNSPKPRQQGPSEWQKRYYGEAKYMSKASASYSLRRQRVHNFYESNKNDQTSHFDGQHKSHDRYDVPHFNYEEHLAKHLKFEQRIINKLLSPEEREAIIRQLSKDGDSSGVSEELITKHLMRQAQRVNADIKKTGLAPKTAHNPHMYAGPQHGYHQEESLTGLKAVLIVGASSALLLYNTLGG